MCLSTVSNKRPEFSSLILSGWKGFNGTTRDPKFSNFSHKGSKDVPLNTWISKETDGTTNGRVEAGDGTHYSVGFHIWPDEKNKPREASRMVYYRRATAMGRQEGCPVIIAEEMYVSSDPEGWPPMPAPPPGGAA